MYGNPYYIPYYETEHSLEHFGVKGMKWGVRRYQNADGTLTEAGKKRLDKYKFKEENRISKRSTSYQKGVERRRVRRERTGAIQSQTKAAKEQKRLSDYKKELSVIKKLSYSDMERELESKKQYNMQLTVSSLLFGVPGTILTSSILTAAGADANTEIRNMRLALYDALNRNNSAGR